MDRGAALLAALRAASSLGDSRLAPERVEELAGALGLEKEQLPTLVARWQTGGQVSIAWGGTLEVLPEASPSAAVVITGTSFGAGAVIAGRDATGGTVSVTPEMAFGALVTVVEKLRRARPSLQGMAAEAADETIKELNAWPTIQAPVEARRAWSTNVGQLLGRLLVAAPQVRSAIELGQEILKNLGWS